MAATKSTAWMATASGRWAVVAEQSHRERHDRDQADEQQVAPKDPVVDAGDDGEDAVVGQPQLAEDHKAEGPGAERGEQPVQCGGEGGPVQVGRHREVDSEQGDRDGEDGVGEGEDPVGLHRPAPQHELLLMARRRCPPGRSRRRPRQAPRACHSSATVMAASLRAPPRPARPGPGRSRMGRSTLTGRRALGDGRLPNGPGLCPAPPAPALGCYATLLAAPGCLGPWVRLALWPGSLGPRAGICHGARLGRARAGTLGSAFVAPLRPRRRGVVDGVGWRSGDHRVRGPAASRPRGPRGGGSGTPRPDSKGRWGRHGASGADDGPSSSWGG
jgi:hypothetical protein